MYSLTKQNVLLEPFYFYSKRYTLRFNATYIYKHFCLPEVKQYSCSSLRCIGDKNLQLYYDYNHCRHHIPYLHHKCIGMHGYDIYKFHMQYQNSMACCCTKLGIFHNAVPVYFFDICMHHKSKSINVLYLPTKHKLLKKVGIDARSYSMSINVLSSNVYLEHITRRDSQR